MSCNGCRVLRKGCNDDCILRQSLTAIETPQAQSSATLFLAKFFGRAALFSFLSDVPHHQRPALFQSLLLEACGRTVNPVNGAVGLLWTGNWNMCVSAVETVLAGGTIHAMPELFSVKNVDDERMNECVEKQRKIMESSDVSETTTSDSSNPSVCNDTKLLYLFL